MDRGAFLRQVWLHLPGAAAWAEFCEDRHSRLLFQGRALSSKSGVQQRNPFLGALFFALALQLALQAARASTAGAGPELVFAYLDDVCLAGGSRQVAAALARLSAAARQVGLQLNPAKCKLVLCVAPRPRWMLFAPRSALNATGSFDLLGAPIGNVTYTEDFTRTERLGEAKPLLQAIAALPDPQTGLLLLRHCAAFCKLVYALRITHSLLGQVPANFDAEVRGCLPVHDCGRLGVAAG